jgi:hypothetical protein
VPAAAADVLIVLVAASAAADVLIALVVASVAAAVDILLFLLFFFAYWCRVVVNSFFIVGDFVLTDCYHRHGDINGFGGGSDHFEVGNNPKALSARGRKKPTFVLPHPHNYVITYLFLHMGC